MTNETRGALAMIEHVISHSSTFGEKVSALGVLQDIAELIEAVKSNRLATERFAQDGCPENYIVYDDSERRISAALAKVTS